MAQRSVEVRGGEIVHTHLAAHPYLAPDASKAVPGAILRKIVAITFTARLCA